MNHKAFPFLDGIRGMAALFVLTRHTGNYWHFSLFRSYLAVDLFFMLSGFVIAFAYDERLNSGTMSRGQFALVRLIRLYPVYFFSLCLCALMAFGKLLMKGDAGVPVEYLITSIALTLIFLPSYLPGNGGLFPLNGPYWSLFFELTANFAYCVVRPLLNTTVLILMIILFGVIMATITVMHGNIDYGFSWGLNSVIGGFTRSIFGILFGLLLFRKRAEILRFFDNHMSLRLSPWLAFVAIASILLSPSAGWLNPIIDIVVVALVFPILIMFSTCGDGGRFQSGLLVLGAASYPIYVLHAPMGELLNFLTRGVADRFAPLSGVILVVLLVWTSIWIEKSYDLPLRRWLAKRFISVRSS